MLDWSKTSLSGLLLKIPTVHLNCSSTLMILLLTMTLESSLRRSSNQDFFRPTSLGKISWPRLSFTPLQLLLTSWDLDNYRSAYISQTWSNRERQFLTLSIIVCWEVWSLPLLPWIWILGGSSPSLPVFSTPGGPNGLNISSVCRPRFIVSSSALILQSPSTTYVPLKLISHHACNVFVLTQSFISSLPPFFPQMWAEAIGRLTTFHLEIILISAITLPRLFALWAL